MELLLQMAFAIDLPVPNVNQIVAARNGILFRLSGSSQSKREELEGDCIGTMKLQLELDKTS